MEELQDKIDPSLAKIRLRPGLTNSLRTANDKAYVMVFDPLQSQYFRLGLVEWKVARLFDGTRTLRQAVRDATSQLGDETTPAEVSRLGHWLVQNELAECVQGSLKPKATDSGAAKQSSAHLWHEPLNQMSQLGRWNPLFLKIALPNPAPVLERLSPWLSWLFSKPFAIVWGLLCAAGCYSVFRGWDRFTSSLGDVFATENWLYLLLVWVVLKVLHELGHAVACLRYGGQVTRCGVMFILFSPIAWVDVTSAWSFRSRWRRIVVSSAGMYVEFLIAAIAAIIWGWTEDPFVATMTRNVVISASVTTLLFNLNFLMRFDGYYILSDLLDIQNLYAAGQQYLQYWNRRYLLGMQVTRPRFRGLKLNLIRAYGFGAMVWRVTFCVGIVIVAAHMFKGAGIVLALFSGAIWFAVPALRFLVLVWKGVGQEKPNRWRFGIICSVLLFIGAVGLLSPWPGRTLAHGVVEFSPLRSIRADSPGFVSVVRVSDGQQVNAGDILLELRNEEVRRELADIELQIEAEAIARRVAHRDNEMAEYEAIGQKLESLREQRLQLMTKVASLQVRAPISGTVIAQHLDTMQGKYVESGTEMLMVGSTGTKEVRISIEQHDIDAFRDPNRQQVRLEVQGHTLPQGAAKLHRLYPRASERVFHPSLLATNGGPLAVQQNPNPNSQEELVLVEPRFEGVVEISSGLSDQLMAGEVCRVSIGRGHQRVYEKLWSFARAYFEYKAGAS